MNRKMRYLFVLAVLLSVIACQRQEQLTIVQLCDPQLGMGIDGFDADVTRLEQAVRQINAIAPDMVVIAGDMVHEANDSLIAVFLDIIAPIKAPVLFTAGNHDLPEPVTEEKLQSYRAHYGNDFSSSSTKGWMIISANTQLWRIAPEKEINRQNELLRETLQKARKEKRPVIMLTHIPPFVESVDEKDEYFNISAQSRETILKLCEENGVFLWLAGHLHKTLKNDYGKISILTGETTSRNFDNHPFGFRLLTIYPDKHFDWEFVELKQ
jgi:Icc-related predicted phosphoesterase